MTQRARWRSPSKEKLGDRFAIGAAFVALILHTNLDTDFLEDPLTWTLLGVGLALAARRGRAGAPTGGRAREQPLAFSGRG